MERRKTGTIDNARLQCNMCKQYNKDNRTLEKIEQKLLHHINDYNLHKIIQHSSKKQTRAILKKTKTQQTTTGKQKERISQ